MNWLDLALTIILAGFVFYGLFFGLIKTVGSLAGVLIGAWGASRLYLLLFSLAGALSFGHDDWGKTISFIVCFTVINRLVCLAFALLDRAFKLMSIVPFLKTINRLGGAVLGLLEGGIVVGLLLFLAARYLPEAGFWTPWFKSSQLVPFFWQFTGILQPLLPELVKQLKSVI